MYSNLFTTPNLIIQNTVGAWGRIDEEDEQNTDGGDSETMVEDEATLSSRLFSDHVCFIYLETSRNLKHQNCFFFLIAPLLF